MRGDIPVKRQALTLALSQRERGRKFENITLTNITFNLNTIMQRIVNLFCAFVLLTFLTGCGSGHVPLSGKVTFSDDGSLLTVGTVGFLKDGHLARGTIQPNGTYSVSFGEMGGLPPGTYQVIVFAEKSTEVPPDSGNYTYEYLIDKKYETPDTSGLTVEVNASTRTFDIQVDRFVSPGGRR